MFTCTVPAKEPTWIDVKVRKTRVATDTFEMIRIPVMDAHRVVHFLMKSGLEIPEAHVEHFWETCRDKGQEPWAVSSPASRKHVPLGLYGDSCKVAGGSKLVGIFINLPLWRPRSNRLSRFLLATIEEHRLWGSETLDAIFAHIVRCCNYLFTGFDENGEELANGRLFAVTELRGDWLFHKQVWKFVSSWNTVHHRCYLCNATSRSRDPKQLFWNVDGEWHWYNRVEFINIQLAHRPRPCSPARKYRPVYIDRSFIRVSHPSFRPVAALTGMAP